jgi:uncharacterized protein YjiS (DUF1127 family)
MLNNISKASPVAPRLVLNPIQVLLKMGQKHRQRQSLRKLDTHALADIGMSVARRDAELRKLRNW